MSHGIAFPADHFRRGEINVGDTVQLVDYIAASMASASQSLGMAFSSPGVEVVRVSRSNKRLCIDVRDGAGNPEFSNAIRDVLATDNAKRRAAGLSAIRVRIGLHAAPFDALSAARLISGSGRLCALTTELMEFW